MKTETFSGVTTANTRKIRRILSDISAVFHIKYFTTSNFSYNIEVNEAYAHIIRMILKLDFRNPNSVERVAKELDSIDTLRELHLDNIIKS